MPGKAFIDHFSALEDPRQAWKVVYPLPEILLVVLCATLSGAEDFVEVARWGTRKLDFLRRLLPYERGIASHDTLNVNVWPAPSARGLSILPSSLRQRIRPRSLLPAKMEIRATCSS